MHKPAASYSFSRPIGYSPIRFPYEKHSTVPCLASLPNTFMKKNYYDLNENTSISLHFNFYTKKHKNNIPLCPIASTIRPPTYSIIKHLTSLLKLYIEKSFCYIKNSTQISEKIKSLHLEFQWSASNLRCHLSIYQCSCQRSTTIYWFTVS